jgi:CubicO group peptidase (beta-lactamase class C family)
LATAQAHLSPIAVHDERPLATQPGALPTRESHDDIGSLRWFDKSKDRTMRRLAGYLFIVAALCHPPVAAQNAKTDDVLQMERKASIPKTRPWPIDWFQPQEMVKGTVARRTAPDAAARSIDPAALKAAGDYAMARETQALLVWRDGHLELARFADGTKASDRLNTYYMHYPVLSLLYGIAIADGHVRSVDDPIGKYITEWAQDPRGKITLRQMLNMSAGLEMYFDDPDPATKASRLFLGSDSTTPALEYEQIEAPGRSFQYNYLIPELLGIALQRALGTTRYADYLSSRLWRPVGNADAALWLDRPGGRPHFNSALFATAEDWLNIGKLILNRGRVGTRQVVPASWIATMKTPSATNPNYGMLWLGSPYQADRRFSTDPRYRYRVKSGEPYLADDLLFLDGYGGQRVYVVPSQKLVIVRIGLTRQDWDDAALPNAILRGLPPLAAPR